MWYLGCRWKDGCYPLETCYFTSSKIVKPKIRANPDDWIREILLLGNPCQVVQIEHNFLVLLDAKNDPMSYNENNGYKSFKSRKGIPKTGLAAKGMPKTGLHAAGMPATGKNAKGKISPNKGIPATGLRAIGLPRGPQTGKNAKGMPRDPMTGKKAKGIPNTGKAAKGIPKTGKYAKGHIKPVVTCPHCGKAGGNNIMRRYHFDNCKLINTE
jgi:hypothetical protein